MAQIPLRVELRTSASLASFVAGRNREAAYAVADVVAGRGERVVLLWGGPGVGKTHLLEAACRELGPASGATTLLPLSTDEGLRPDFLAGLEHLSLICIDDVHVVAGDAAWEQALFDLYNRAEQADSRLLISTARRVLDLRFELPDLQSRLASVVAFQLRELDDEERHTALRARARERGFEIPSDVATYLLRRRSRDMHSLMALVDCLDQSTLAEQRSVTIPFVKQLLDA